MLDFNRLLPQMKSMAAERLRRLSIEGDALREAQAALCNLAPDWKALARKVEEAKTSSLLALPREQPDVRHPLPPCPPAYTALAVDGSQIAPDRHETAFCYLLNIGTVLLRYGDNATAQLESLPTLAFADDEMFEDAQDVKLGATGKRLGARRVLAECDALAGLIEAQTEETTPVLALLDSPLIFWWFESDSPEYRQKVITQYQKLLDTARRHRVPIAGYISRPGSRDVIQLLRTGCCPRESSDPDRVNTSDRDFEDLTDELLFEAWLRPGERSALFGSRSSILRLYSEENRIDFFYLHVGDEVARVEVPRWVSEDDALLRCIHSLLHDQVEKGAGYPRALTEAHERAVVRGSEHSAFFRMLETAYARQGIPVRGTRKALAKRTRSV